jgi:hypothetical protein
VVGQPFHRFGRCVIEAHRPPLIDNGACAA